MKITPSPAERTALARRAAYLSRGMPAEAAVWRIELLREQAATLRAEADRREREARELLMGENAPAA